MGTIHSTPQKELVLQPFYNTSWEAPSEYQPWESFFECSVCKECLYEDEYIVIYNKMLLTFTRNGSYMLYHTITK